LDIDVIHNHLLIVLSILVFLVHKKYYILIRTYMTFLKATSIIVTFLMLLLTNARGTAITGRISMGLRDPVQCGYKYDQDEVIKGYPIAAVDGKTFGSLYDAKKTDICGKLVKIAGVTHIIVDRIWENDGDGGYIYNNKYNADHKIHPLKKGYTQYDTAIFTYWKRGGNADLKVEDVGKVGDKSTTDYTPEELANLPHIPEAQTAPILPDAPGSTTATPTATTTATATTTPSQTTFPGFPHLPGFPTNFPSLSNMDIPGFPSAASLTWPRGRGC
jgi:hypothetical protein